MDVTYVTPISPESLRKRYERLKPWLELTNLLGPPVEVPDPEHPNVRTRAFLVEHSEFFRRFEASGLSNDPEFKSLRWSSDVEARDRLLKLAYQIARNLSFLARAAEDCRYFEDSDFLRHDDIYGLCIEPIDSAAASIWIQQGTFNTRISDPYKGFLDALAGAEAGRLRRCPICERIFYALRLTQRACSKRCNQNRRVRQWRNKQSEYEYNRKLRSSGLKPRGTKR
jgi:hypothetical protein